MNNAAQPDQRVAVLDFGAQYGQLIARRIRDLKVYSEIVPGDISATELAALKPSAVILSGGPASVYAEDAPQVDPGVFELGVPVLGFCYGQQAMAVALGGEVGHTEKGEYGGVQIELAGHSRLLEGTPQQQTVWMSHRDAVTRAPEGFTITSRTSTCPVASMECPERGLYATQFHPEVRHSAHGNQMLQNFLFDICGLTPSWTMNSIIDDSVAAIRAQVGDARVILGLSGGVDSSVVAALCARAIGKQLTCVFVNHGLLRKNEPEEVEEVFTRQFDVDFVHVHAEERYEQLLAGITDPEEKRRIIGSQFWNEFFAVAQDLDGVRFLAQGTIYPDIIESGARKTGGKASTIKSHHNLIPFPEGVHFDLIEPLDHFFKDEVRALGTALGLPDHIVHRQPFPGPGLAIRIIGAVDREKLTVLKEADAIVREELDAYNERLFRETGERNGEGSVWQYFAVLPDVRSVGVMGDERTYARPVILRAVESSDAMTADWAKLPYEVLTRISGRIVAEVPGVNRVAYDITSKPPATIEWE
ncbi:glutamine-hydrolyzing GMP synthase [Eggerthellaceae bacterium zg-1084]|uniref:GMP synthase [glutamine-hydrolyzing] n=1 Tax=Berryella wangjianweii TaxID=2734634 RepID=A0A6M8J6M7_9ACTN|nr:glutamine-hydrolyzing GMP synthase [Berryella wangjianweii]NPD30380.1 glutamine-hydrolyzing GMP synthase [Berryella wangjianweii]QKF07059.1 glutamine-hydrolyzing GMP synthase [Berryella wangjianweii]